MSGRAVKSFFVRIFFDTARCMSVCRGYDYLNVTAIRQV